MSVGPRSAGQLAQDDKSPMVQNLTNQNLWARALRQFQEAEPQLADKFASSVNAKVGPQDLKKSVVVASPQKHPENVPPDSIYVSPEEAESAVTMILETDEVKHASHKLPAKIRSLFEETVRMVLSASDLITPAIAFNPYAATAWSAVCFILPLCLAPSKENEAAIQGLHVISNLMTVYKWKEKVYLEGNDGGDFAQATVKLYVTILKYEATLLTHQQSRRIKRVTNSISKSGQWEALVSQCRELDSGCSKITLAIDAARAQDWENEQREWRLIHIKQVHNEKMRANLRKLYSKYEEGKNSNPLPQKGTGEWFFRHPKFLEWRNSTCSSCLWLKADPGLGKSVLARQLVENRALASTQGKTPLICYFFFKKDDSEKETATKAVCALLHQLYLQESDLYRYAEVDFENKGDIFLTDLDALWAIFRDSVMDPSNEEVLCILDGLDECEEITCAKLLSNLTTYFQLVSTNSSSCVKVLVTSRPMTSISRCFKALQETPSFGIISGSDVQDVLSQEIEAFIPQKVAEIAKELSLTKRQQRLLRSKISAAPNRTYLWLHLVLNLVSTRADRSDNSISHVFDDIPVEVEQAYNELLNQISVSWIEEAEAIFSVILAANRPLTLEELEGALHGIRLSENSYIYTGASEFGARCGHFLTIVDNRVYMIHQTARDFLMWSFKGPSFSKPLPSGVRNWKGAFRAAENHYRLFLACFSLLKSQVVQESTAVRSLRLRTTRDWRTQFLDYAATYWAQHLLLADSKVHDDQLLSDISTELYQNEKVFHIWSSIYKGSPLGQSTDFPGNRSPIFWSSYFGHLPILNRELEKTVNVDQRDSSRRSPLLYACEQGHIKAVELLLKKGASAESRDLLDSSVLSLAAESGNESLVKLFINRGVTVDHVDALNLTPFQYAAHQKKSGCMQLLKIEQPKSDMPVAGVFVSEDNALKSLDRTLQILQDTHTSALKSGLWISDDEDLLCYSLGTLTGTGFSAMYNGVLSGLHAYDQKNYHVARSQLLYAISHTETILQTESPLTVPHFLRIVAKVDHHGIPRLALALCKHIKANAGVAKNLSGMIDELFSAICRVLSEPQVKASALAEIFLNQVVASFHKELGAHHMQTIYVQHLQLQTKALLHGLETIIFELEALLAEIKSHKGQDCPQYIQISIDLSQIRLDCKQYKQAEELGQQIVAGATALMSKPKGLTGKTLRMQCEGHRLVAESQSAQGLHDEAESQFRQAINLAKSLPRVSIFSMVDKYETQFADWLRARGRKEEAAMLISTNDESVMEETEANQGIYNYFLKRGKQLQDVHNDYEQLKKSLTNMWPERLLSVDDMTSVQLEDENTYATITQPTYNILSYKWGLWVIQEGDRLDIGGVDWKIPPIDPQRWTVDEMEQLLEKIAEDVDFVWLDVACVDQSQNSATMNEIQREPGIFMNAEKVFVWLVDCSVEDLNKYLNSIAEAAQDLPERGVEQFDEGLILSALMKALEPLAKLLSCAWFRSHWTLREIISRRDAVLLDRSGSPVLLRCRNDEEATLDVLVFVCQHLLAWLTRQGTAALRNTDTADNEPEDGWHGRMDESKSRLLDFVSTAGPFLLFSYDPLELRMITERLLTVGQKVTEGASENDYSHGSMVMACYCSEDHGQCLACIMGISYKVGDTVLSARSFVRID